MTTMRPGQSRDPQYWNFLSTADKEIYRRITAALSAPRSRNQKGRRIEDFSQIIQALEVFEGSDDDGKWKRCLVCGLCRIPEGIAVNTTQLKRLVFRCKSSINGSLKGIGYGRIISSAVAYESLFKQIPYLRHRPADIRQWTIRTCDTSPSDIALDGRCEADPEIQFSETPGSAGQDGEWEGNSIEELSDYTCDME
jgi:hypothetical protein